MKRIGVITISLVTLVWAAPALAQTLGQGREDSVPWLRLFAALLLCVVLAVGAALALRQRLGVSGAVALPRWGVVRRLLQTPAATVENRLTDVETRRLSPGLTASTFLCAGRRFVVIATVQGQLRVVEMDGVDQGSGA